ncbi:uncharacterized protein LOC130623857 [Hydractinia symbiolongicarpus]|uniref:uncharacterized protein LOC130623857 n=1 Tax=Hydractinia symbiolongicarpus TaxID=13093 RepID=UPI00254DA6BE|nr:uncharacterized protein LOC130623857 [Hydractinia symbiolongicarpus]
MAYQGGTGYGYGGITMPMPYGQQQQQSMSTPYPTTSTSTPYPTSSSTPYPSNTIQQHPMINTNEIDMWMDQLVANLTALMKDATKTELDDIVNNEDKINELVQDAEQTKKLLRKRDELITSNKDQAVTNMSLEPEIKLLKDNIVELASQQNELKDKHVQLQQRLAGKISLDGVLAILQAAAAEKETESENISQAFVEGDKTIEQFVEQFIPERKTYQLRKVKSEKMTQLLQSGAISVNRSSGVMTGGMPRPTPAPRQRVQPLQSGYSGYGGY